MIALKPYILYSLPQSRESQAIIGRKIEKSFMNVSRFLETCTSTQSNLPKSISLQAFTAYGEDESSEDSEKIIYDTIKFFGEGVTEPIGYKYPSGQPHEQKSIQWDLKQSDLKSAIDLLKQGEPYPKFNLGPLDLIVSYEFKLIDLETRIELSDQQYSSSILIWLSRTCSCNLTLWFPFNEPTDSFYSYFTMIEQIAPCKLDKKYLRLVMPNKKKTNNVYKKIAHNKIF